MTETNSAVRPASGSSRPRWMAAGLGTLLIGGAAFTWWQLAPARPAVSQTAAPQQKAAPRDAATNNAVAKVNGQFISYDDLAKECVNRHGVEVLESLINRLLIQQACEQRNITVTRAEVEQEVQSIAKKFNLPLDAWYGMLESERGISKEQYHSDIIWPMIALRKLAGSEVQVTEKDMQVGFERDFGPRVKARLILVQGNIRQANTIWEKCQANPDDFDRIAREHSADPHSRPLGGVIPPIRRHGGSKQLEQVAFKLKEGEISPVVQLAENEYVILKCEGHTEPVVTDIKTVWNDLYNQLTEEKSQEAVAAVFEGLKSRAQVTNHLTRKTTGPQQVRPVGGTATPNPAVKPAANAQPGTAALPESSQTR